MLDGPLIGNAVFNDVIMTNVLDSSSFFKECLKVNFNKHEIRKHFLRVQCFFVKSSCLRRIISLKVSLCLEFVTVEGWQCRSERLISAYE